MNCRRRDRREGVAVEMSLVYLIGIGPGGPEYLTMQAVAALRQVDVFFILEKDGRGKEALAETRRTILDTYRDAGTYRVVVAPSPGRAPAGDDYLDVVAAWHRQKAELIAGLIAGNLAPGETGGFLIWGDPALYDGSIEIFRRIQRENLPDLHYEVIPGITSVQVLAARHRIPLNAVGDDVLITTARQMEAGACDGHNSAVVMLDSNAAFRRIAPDGFDIYWGGYLGTDDEVLMSGSLEEVGEEIAATVAREKRRHGWILDIYLLKRRR
jgi:precorrin-6A synthase